MLKTAPCVTTQPLLPAHGSDVVVRCAHTEGGWEHIPSFHASQFGLTAAATQTNPTSIAVAFLEILIGRVLADYLNTGELDPADVEQMQYPASREALEQAPLTDVGGFLVGFWVVAEAKRRLTYWLLPAGMPDWVPPLDSVLTCDHIPAGVLPVEVYNAATDAMTGPELTPNHQRTVLWGIWERCVALAGTIDPLTISNKLGIRSWEGDPTFLARVSSRIASPRRVSDMHGGRLGVAYAEDGERLPPEDVTDNGAGIAAWVLSHDAWHRVGESVLPSVRSVFVKDALELTRDTQTQRIMLMFSLREECSDELRQTVSTLLVDMALHTPGYGGRIPNDTARAVSAAVGEMSRHGVPLDECRLRVESVFGKNFRALNVLDSDEVNLFWERVNARYFPQAE